MTADIAFYVRLACAAEGPLVELAVGSGRVSIPVARAAGRPVTGIDTSAVMLAQARDRAARAGAALDLREGDMRDLALDELDGLIYCPVRALLHVPSWADRRRTFERVAASLRLGGRFAWNAFDYQSPPAWMVSTRTSQCRTPAGTPWVTTGSTSSWTPARRVPYGGPPRTSGSGSSTWSAWTWRRFTAASSASRSPMRAVSMCSSPAVPGYPALSSRAYDHQHHNRERT